MAIWGPFKLLFPGYLAFWAFCFVVSAAFWYGWTWLNRKTSFKWQVPVLASFFFSFIFSGFNFLTIYNNGILYTASQAAQQQTQTAQNDKMDPALKVKAEFLAELEKAMQNPTAIDQDLKKRIFSKYEGLFKGAETKDIYYKNISRVYTCQRTFWEDALASFKTKRKVISEAQKTCNNYEGKFFGREKMMPENARQQNEKLLEDIAGHKRIPASDGKDTELTEKMIRDAIDGQGQNMAALHKIFE